MEDVGQEECEGQGKDGGHGGQGKNDADQKCNQPKFPCNR